MTWLAWRQFRTQAIAGAACLVLLLGAVLLTWQQVSDLATSTGYTGCAGDACLAAAENFADRFQLGLSHHVYLATIGALYLMPALIGVFWGAPVVARELETGTYRMVFSQSVGRGRWLLIKVAIGGLTAALGAGLFSLLLTRWAQRIDSASGDRITPLIFAGRGIVPIGYAALAFVVGVTVGMVLRRTVVAMAVTLLVVAGLQVAAPMVVRPWLAQPITVVKPLDVSKLEGIGMDVDSLQMHLRAEADQPGAWIVANEVVTSTGALFVGPADAETCLPRPGGTGPERCQKWLSTQNLSQKLTYVPGSKFWTLQWREFGLLVVLTLVLTLFSLWWIRRRLV
ncbi:ABC transporter permease subunit [Actinoplanes regularis]|uniref:ABC transporter permease subunit n=1 Tax=Actinoplanes regularis TaxID=52697 RepID=UPI0024A0E5A4|nr:ABC transporter permease subunit [Actinoplanes regularis]GLW28223.1 transporter [Actinoplanes regularis]